MSNKKIAISGRSGCGNTTVSRLVAEFLGFEMINYTFRTLAEDLGLTFEELVRRAEEDDSYDKQLDRRQLELAEPGGCVLGSRLAVWLLEDADLKVYLNASPEVRSRRIMKREGGSFEEKLEETLRRDERDARRYKRIYGIDTSDLSIADVIIDTDHCNQHDAARIIIDAFLVRTARQG